MTILAAVLLLATGAAVTVAQEYDLVLAGGRVMDPESGLDGVRNVGIANGKIAVISNERLAGKAVIDVSGLVVAPGFIDLHAHGQQIEANRYQARDGVTTALELEIGVHPVAVWYASRDGKALINYGATVSHPYARIKLLEGIGVADRTTNPSQMVAFLSGSGKGTRDVASSEEIERLLALLKNGLDQGALGIGAGIQYTPGARRYEIFRVFQLAAQQGAPFFIHPRNSGAPEPGSISAVQEIISNAVITGASAHLAHVTSSGRRQTSILLEMIEGARRRGIDVTTEAYPYTAASTGIGTAVFDRGWQERTGISYGEIQWAATGERLTKETFNRYRKEQPDGIVVIHMLTEEIVEQALAHPLVMVASDGMPWMEGRGHPRGAGTFARVLGHYSRERGVLSLMDALAKMTIMPARRLEKFVPQMRNKGRIRVAADADITVFDPIRVIDRATFENPLQYSHGIEHVLVGGTFVVKNSKLVGGVFPGQAIRRTPLTVEDEATGDGP